MTLEELQERISALPPDVRCSPDRLFGAVLDLYESERVDGTSLNDDGDMLLFQWGSYDWGDGCLFEIDLTWQAILAEEEDSDILQLHCTFGYDPKPFEGIDAGNRWCGSPAEIGGFRKFVMESEGLRQAASHIQVSARIGIESGE